MPEPDKFDALIAAPKSHKVIFENFLLRILLVSIGPGKKEPIHHQPQPSIMFVYQRTRIEYYDGEDNLQFTSPKNQSNLPIVEYLRPEPLHAVKNIGTRTYRGVRLEFKSV